VLGRPRPLSLRYRMHGSQEAALRRPISHSLISSNYVRSYMRKFQTSIAGLMVFTVLIGVGAASLLNASRLWAGVIPMLTWLMLLTAILGVTFRTGEDRAFWAGFLVFGWGYVLSSACGDFSSGVLVNPSEESRCILLWLDLKKTLTPAIGEYSDVVDYRKKDKYVKAKVLDSYSPGYYNVQFDDGVKVGANINSFRKTNEEFYLVVGDSLCNLLVAFTGMLVGRFFYASRTEK
jgi:hypothetical protein